MTELGTVLSTETIRTCPRTLLGHACLATSGGYECICEGVEAATLEVVPDDKGAAAVLTMLLRPEVSEWKSIRRGIDLSGYVASWRESAGSVTAGTGKTVTVTFDLWRPVNRALRDRLQEEAS